MKAQELKVGSILEIEIYKHTENGVITQKKNVTICRISDHYVWFKGNNLQRLGKNTINKYPCFYKIISI